MPLSAQEIVDNFVKLGYKYVGEKGEFLVVACDSSTEARKCVTIQMVHKQMRTRIRTYVKDIR